MDYLYLIFRPLRFPFVPSLVPQPLSILMEGANFLAIKIRNWICSTLSSGVDAVSDNMLVELAVACFNERHGAPVRYAPER